MTTGTPASANVISTDEGVQMILLPLSDFQKIQENRVALINGISKLAQECNRWESKHSKAAIELRWYRRVYSTSGSTSQAQEDKSDG